MVTAAKKTSEVATHMLIAFAIMHFMTGSAAFGGLAAIVEPIINVLLLPLHERAWHQIQSQARSARLRYLTLGMKKLCQVGLHMTVAFIVMYWATGSMAYGGLAAVLEPICSVIVLPLHERLWTRLQASLAGQAQVLAR